MSALRIASPIGFALLLLAVGSPRAVVSGDEPSKPAGREPWTTSRVVGSPDPPPPFKTVNAFPNVKLTHALLVGRIPGTDRLIVAEQTGKVVSFRKHRDAKPEVFFDPRAEIKNLDKTPGATEVESTYAVAFHPKFAANRFVYVCYTLKGKPGVANLPDGSRVSRFTVTADPPRIDPASEEIVLTFLQGGHNGCDMHFGPDGHLYITTGDAAAPNPPDPLHTGQDITDLLSSILRIDVDRKDPGKNYAVPKDNPFVGLKVGDKDARGEVWAYGFRNPWRMSFDRKTGDLWVGDVGWELWESVHKVQKGGNYGWSITEARQPVNVNDKPGPTPIIRPVIEIPHTAGCSVTGGYVYRGKKFPELVGAYIFGDWETRRVWSAKLDVDPPVLTELVKPTVRVVAFGEDEDGELYFADYDQGTIHTLERNDADASDPAKFPRTLSATGLFSSVKDHAPAPGVYRFEVNAHQWQDHATAEHLVALPGTSSVTDHEVKKVLPGNVDWHFFRYHFPKDAVLVKTLSLDAVRGDPATRRRVETQLLHFDGQNWNGYTFAWRDDQTDADLVPADGSEKTFTVADPTVVGGKREQTWTFHSRAQCVMCHNAWAEYSLAFNPEQLNRSVGTKNQLSWFEEFGMLKRLGKDDKPKPSYTPEELKKERKLADPFDEKAPLADRARSYLHVNCGHCHRFGGGGAVDFELQAYTDRKIAALAETRPLRGTFELPDPRVLVFGAPGRSVLYYRLAKFGSGRMPHLGSDLPDPRGLTLIRDWLLASSEDGGLIGLSWEELEKRLASPATALEVARGVGANEFPPATRDRIVKAAAASPSAAVRDLFEGYQPTEGRERKLGQNPRPKTILALQGDPARGKDVFFAEKSKCATCHKIDGQGKDVGPDLSAIAKTRSREFLLESLLDPSRRVEPQYQAYLLRTHDGRAFTGLLVRKDGKEVVLKDAEGQEHRVAADNVEKLQPARDSLMPTGQLADFTPQQAADLLEYLATRKSPNPASGGR